jgi:hypothetical protein
MAVICDPRSVPGAKGTLDLRPRSAKADTVANWFWGAERKLIEPPMRFTRGDVRGHISYPKSIRTSVVALIGDAAAEKSEDRDSSNF